MEATKKNKTSLKERFGFDFKRFSILTRILLHDKMKISFKANKKQSLIKIFSLLILFAVLCSISYVFYYFSETLNLFSVLKYVPLSVPSIISAALFIFSIFSITIGLTNALYYSEDNRLMLTYPCNGNTIFMARIFSFFINEYVRNLTIQIPLLFGYMLVMAFPWYMFIWLFISFIFITALEVLLGSLLSIPAYYISLFLNRNSLVKIIVYGALFIAIFGFFLYVVLLIPSSIDIFTNWGPYFTKIQSVLSGYKTYCLPFYCLTIFSTGNLVGFNVEIFSSYGLITGLVILLGGLSFFVLDMIVVNPLYLKLASSSFEFESNSVFSSKKDSKRSYFRTQIHKESLLFSKDPSLLMSILTTFVFLPIIVALLNKVFGAMNLNANGEVLVQVINLIVILIIALNANTIVAGAYSSEGSAFQYNRVYPKRSYFMLLSKLLFPSIISIISLIISSLLFSHLFKLNNSGCFYLLIFTLVFINLGHMLFAAQYDFCSTKSQFSVKGNSKSQLVTTITAFVLPLFLGVLFYLYLKDGQLGAYLKMFFIGLIFLILNIYLFIYRTKLVYSEGN